MAWFQKEKQAPSVSAGALASGARAQTSSFIPLVSTGWGERRLYEGLRQAVPVVDAALGKLVRLTGGFSVLTEDEDAQEALDDFASSVRVGLSGRSLESFLGAYLESLLLYGTAVGEILTAKETGEIAGLVNGDPSWITVRQGKSPVEPAYYTGSGKAEAKVRYPGLILFTALNPPPGSPYGVSILRGLPILSGILLRIYESVGQNFDRVGNVRYAVTYRPSGEGDRVYAKERAMQIAKEWSEGMAAGASGQIRDFVAVGDVDIKVIGADNQVLETEVPVRQLLEQIIAKLGIPPFLLGLNWSTTERMSRQQADILTSELECYRRLLTPVILQICGAFLRLRGTPSTLRVEWNTINLQDESELAQSRFYNARAAQIEQGLQKEGNA